MVRRQRVVIFITATLLFASILHGEEKFAQDAGPGVIYLDGEDTGVVQPGGQGSRPVEPGSFWGDTGIYGLSYSAGWDGGGGRPLLFKNATGQDILVVFWASDHPEHKFAKLVQSRGEASSREIVENGVPPNAVFMEFRRFRFHTPAVSHPAPGNFTDQTFTCFELQPYSRLREWEPLTYKFHAGGSIDIQNSPSVALQVYAGANWKLTGANFEMHVLPNDAMNASRTYRGNLENGALTFRLVHVDGPREDTGPEWYDQLTHCVPAK